MDDLIPEFDPPIDDRKCSIVWPSGTCLVFEDKSIKRPDGLPVVVQVDIHENDVELLVDLISSFRASGLEMLRSGAINDSQGMQDGLRRLEIYIQAIRSQAHPILKGHVNGNG